LIVKFFSFSSKAFQDEDQKADRDIIGVF